MSKAALAGLSLLALATEGGDEMTEWSDSVTIVTSKTVSSAEVTNGLSAINYPLPRQKIRIISLAALDETTAGVPILVGFRYKIAGLVRLIPLNNDIPANRRIHVIWTGKPYLDVMCEGFFATFREGIVANDSIILYATYQVEKD